MIKIIGFVIVILLGISMFVYGGYDDSPGGQLLGLVAVMIGIVRIHRYMRKKKS